MYFLKLTCSRSVHTAFQKLSLKSLPFAWSSFKEVSKNFVTNFAYVANFICTRHEFYVCWHSLINWQFYSSFKCFPHLSFKVHSSSLHNWDFLVLFIMSLVSFIHYVQQLTIYHCWYQVNDLTKSYSVFKSHWFSRFQRTHVTLTYCSRLVVSTLQHLHR